jgi:hypothetical protein
MKLCFSCVVVLYFSLTLSAAAQNVGDRAAIAPVPPLIQFSNIAADEGGNPISGAVNITFSLYDSQRGGEPLWSETQNDVQLDASGHYSVQLGITNPNGVPTALFTSGGARWLAVKIAQLPEQPRVLLLSVPYAIKAGDAATIGGLPPSAFMLALQVNGGAPAASSEPASGESPQPASGTVTGAGKYGYLPVWDSANDIVDSAILQSVTTSDPIVQIKASAVEVEGELQLLNQPAAVGAGADSQPLQLTASAINSATGKPVNQTFQWQAEPSASGTASPSGTLNLLFGAGGANAAETGVSIGSTGLFKFNPAQTFPNTVSRITTSTAGGLTGGGGGALSLSLTKECASGQVLQWFGGATGWKCSTVKGVGGISGTGTANYLSMFSSGSAVVDSNVFQSTTGGTSGYVGIGTTKPMALLDVKGAINSATGFDIEGVDFAYGSFGSGSGSENVFLGFSGNRTITGTDNTGTGIWALNANTTGGSNTANGFNALLSNTTGYGNTSMGRYSLENSITGNGNTAVGASAVGANLSGNYNTGLGYNAGPDYGTGGLNNSTAIGAYADVAKSNSLVLGGISNINGCTTANKCASTNVGIGTTKPAFPLDVAGTIRSSAGGFMFPDGSTQATAAGTIAGTAPIGVNTSGGTATVSLTTACASGQVLQWFGATTGWQCSTVSGVGGISGTGTAGYLPLFNSGNAVVDSSVFQSTSGNTNGFVGIGTAAPQAALDVNGAIAIGGYPFAYNTSFYGSALVGFSGNSMMTGEYNTSIGFRALQTNSTGQGNTAVGEQALQSNATGSYNTAGGVLGNLCTSQQPASFLNKL